MADENLSNSPTAAQLPDKTIAAPSLPSPAAAEALKRGPEAVRRSMPMGLSIALGILLAGVLSWFFHYLISFILVLYLSFIAATIMEAPVQWLRRLGLRRGYAAVIVMVGSLALIFAILTLLANGLYNQVTSVSTNLQKAPDQINTYVNDLKKHFPAIGQHMDDFNVSAEIAKSLPSISALWANALQGIAVVSWLVIMFFIVLYMLIDGADHLVGLRVLVPRARRLEVTRLFNDIAKAHRGWALASISNVVSASILTSLGLWLIGIPGEFLLGFIAGLGELIPTIGPVAGAALGILFTLLADPDKFWWVVAMFIVVQTIQSYTISPLMLKFSVELPVLVTILSIVTFGILYGFLGILVAIPFVADMVVIWTHMNRYLEKDTEDYDLANAPPADGARPPLTTDNTRIARLKQIFRRTRNRPNAPEPTIATGMEKLAQAERQATNK